MAQQQPSLSLFESVTNKDYDAIADLYADNARRTILSFLAMRHRWSPFVGIEKSEEKCNEFLQQIACQESKLGYVSAEQSPPVHSFGADDVQYHSVLNELGLFLTETVSGEDILCKEDDFGDEGYQDMDCDFPTTKLPHQASWKSTSTAATERVSWATSSSASLSSSTTSRAYSRSNSNSSGSSHHEANEGVNRLLWDSAAIYSDSRPPSNFVVYNANGDNTRNGGREEGPPLFDGSVANSTPPPLGGISAGPSGGSGTILHLACALDAPLALALLLAMGADARSTHTAFRRLMIHEAACNGSIQCLTLLLELGQACAQGDEQEDRKMMTKRLPESARYTATQELRFLDQNAAASYSEYQRRRSKEVRSRGGLFGVGGGGNQSQSASSCSSSTSSTTDKPKGDFLQFLRMFRDFTAMVKNGFMTELDAARAILARASLAEPSRVSLAHSCTFQKGPFALSRGIFRPRGGGCADGHGNTPLHWAAFKNEVKCVSLLLAYNADPNARAHPSGWTPLHDAAYSNSKESIALLVGSGAQVDARANSGATPLCFAAQEDAADAAFLLLERGADLATRCAGGPYVRSDDDNGNNHHPHSRFSGYTPLHYCAHYNAHHAARVLLANTAAKKAMEISDLSERLPIHVAVARGSSDVLRELLHAGARVETPQSRQRAQSLVQRRAEAAVERPAVPPTPRARNLQPPGAVLSTPTRASPAGSDSTPVSSPVLRAMIPAQPINSSKPWNCLSQRSIDECRALISHAEQNWTPERHLLFTPADRRAVMELLRVGKRLELQGSGIFLDLWPLILSFCGRGWFEIEGQKKEGEEEDMPMCSVARLTYERNGDADLLMLPSLTR
ncbi:Ankyrin Repeat Protein [Seminavis robusta]|uniref:Ankyrin Repeat Protein n=1 Tax=Seminavis robusta TaxID=568900 RepID=A0A9N8HPN1_9STRA|nr:Ankyrin Repeat Protein [Seminavis robusta]|eukprot:Sro1107_g242110.1 Ankyrin Repeat Protein (849) ;mRNA; r:25689-28634